MRNHKNNITLSLSILILSFVNIIFNITNTSALSYQSPVGISFTFNPTLNINISSDLVINSLVPGSSSDSNIVNVAVATNTAYGYTLSATTGNNNLIRSDNVGSIFSSISNSASYSNLEDFNTNASTNTWSYSYKDNNITSPTWSNYSGLAAGTNTILLDTNGNNTETGIDSIDFKIAAKASSAQPSGIYTGVINFTAVTKPTPITLAEAYASEGKTMINGFYTMQDMTSTICERTEAIGSQLQVLDIRDYKVYWIAKLADDHCWMTQNLDLDLDSTRTYTHWDTDLGWSLLDENITWQPIRSTINFTGENITGWRNSKIEPYSANPGDIYYYTSNSDTNDIQYNSLQECVDAGQDDCGHYHAGNYYNWSAAIASNNTSELNIQYYNAPNSICPGKWKMPVGENEDKTILDFGELFYKQGIASDKTANIYTKNGFYNLRRNPLYMIRSAFILTGILRGDIGSAGYYWSSTINNQNKSYGLSFGARNFLPANNNEDKYYGFSVRCLAR